MHFLAQPNAFTAKMVAQGPGPQSLSFQRVLKWVESDRGFLDNSKQLEVRASLCPVHDLAEFVKKQYLINISGGKSVHELYSNPHPPSTPPNANANKSILFTLVDLIKCIQQSTVEQSDAHSRTAVLLATMAHVILIWGSSGVVSGALRIGVGDALQVSPGICHWWRDGASTEECAALKDICFGHTTFENCILFLQLFAQPSVGLYSQLLEVCDYRALMRHSFCSANLFRDGTDVLQLIPIFMLERNYPSTFASISSCLSVATPLGAHQIQIEESSQDHSERDRYIY